MKTNLRLDSILQQKHFFYFKTIINSAAFIVCILHEYDKMHFICNDKINITIPPGLHLNRTVMQGSSISTIWLILYAKMH